MVYLAVSFVYIYIINSAGTFLRGLLNYIALNDKYKARIYSGLNIIKINIYSQLYLQLRLTWKGSKLLRHFLQFICIMMAWFTAMTRISNYKHHWSDVLAGSSIGTIIAFIMVRNHLLI